MRAIRLCFGLCWAVFVLAACGQRFPIGGDDGGSDARPADASSMDARPSDGGLTECILPNDRRCPVGMTCELSRCADGTPLTCYCAADGAPRCTGACPPPGDASTDATPPPPDATGSCTLPGGVRCGVGMTCQYSRCADGTPLTCFCAADGMPLCTGACPPPDAGRDASPPPPPPDAAGECVLPGGVRCGIGMTCEYSRCADGTPLSCFCGSDGVPRCTGACPPPPPPPDAGRDCRTDGCPPGGYCAGCLAPGGAVYACIPIGSAC